MLTCQARSQERRALDAHAEGELDVLEGGSAVEALLALDGRRVADDPAELRLPGLLRGSKQEC